MAHRISCDYCDKPKGDHELNVRGCMLLCDGCFEAEQDSRGHAGNGRPVNSASATVARYENFLNRFVGRGWLHATRDNEFEQEAVDFGVRVGWLRRELSEAHFTPKGRRALSCLS